MIANQKSSKALLTQAIRDSAIEAIRRIISEDPKVLYERPVAGPWLNIAARHSSVETVRLLLDLGAKPSEKDESTGENALCRAAASGALAKVVLLFNSGTEIDLSEPIRNPLISAVFGSSVEVAKFLLDAGIDATVRYEMAEGVFYDALCFALEQGTRDIASLLALHLAGGDRAAAQAELDRGWAAVAAANPNANPANIPPPPRLDPPYQ